VPLIVPKRTTFAGLVYDRLQDTGADIPQQVGRLVTKPQLKKDVKRPRLVILGSGWASHSFAKVVDAVKYDVVIVSPRNYFLFTPMLASTAVGTIEFRSIVEPIRKANEFIDYFEATCLGINAQDQVQQTTLHHWNPVYVLLTLSLYILFRLSSVRAYKNLKASQTYSIFLTTT